MLDHGAYGRQRPKQSWQRNKERERERRCATAGNGREFDVSSADVVSIGGPLEGLKEWTTARKGSSRTGPRARKFIEVGPSLCQRNESLGRRHSQCSHTVCIIQWAGSVHGQFGNLGEVYVLPGMMEWNDEHNADRDGARTSALAGATMVIVGLGGLWLGRGRRASDFLDFGSVSPFSQRRQLPSRRLVSHWTEIKVPLIGRK